MMSIHFMLLIAFVFPYLDVLRKCPRNLHFDGDSNDKLLLVILRVKILHCDIYIIYLSIKTFI